MNGKTSLVAFGGLSLVLANAWASGIVQDLAHGQTPKHPAGQHWYQTPWGQVGYEMAGVLVATFIAGASDGAATVFLVLIGGLWLLWLINHFASTGKGAKP